MARLLTIQDLALLTLRDQKGYRLVQYEFQARQPSAQAEVREGAPARLVKVKGVFKTTMSELATLFGVSRQAIYNWQAGDQLSALNEERLDSLSRAADIVSLSGRALRVSAFRRPLPGGQSLLEALISGQDVQSTCQALFNLLDSESQHGQRFGRRTARLEQRSQDSSDAGLPHFNE